MTSPAPFKKMLPPFPGPKQADGTSKEIEPVELFTKTWGAAVCDGFYPLGLNGQWHGGIHFDADTNSKFNQGDGVRCIADGEVIAYRFDDIPPKSIYKNFEQVNAQFATGFVLVRHRLQIPVEFAQPPATSSGGTATPSGGAAPNAPPPPSFVFYSLYMHLLNWKAYEDDPGIKRPGFLGIDSNSGFVGEKCIVPAPSGQNWGHTNSEGVVENPAPPAGKKGEDVLDARAGQNNAIIGWVPGGTQLTLGKTIGDHRLIVGIKGDSYRLNSINQTGLIAHGKIKVSNLDTVIKPPQVKDAVHIMPEPVAIKAGDLVGHLGNYLRFNPEVLNKATHRSVVHMEVITGNGLFEFIEKCRELDANAADTLKNLLLIKKGAKPVGPSGPSARLAGGGFMVDETGPKEGEWMKLLRGSFEVIEKGKLTGWDKAKKRYGSDKDPKYFYQALKPNVASGTTPDPTKPGDFTDPKSGAEFIGKEANFPQHTWRKVFIPGQEVVWIHRSSHSYLSQQTRSGVFEVIDNSYVEGWARFPLKAGEGEVGEPVLATQVYDLKKKDNPFVTSYALDDANPAHRWWKVSYPVMTKNGCVGPQTGWVCEKDFEKVCKCSPWAWPGFEMSVGEDSLGPLEYYKRRLAKDYQPEKSAYLKQLFEVLDEDGNKQLTSKELRQGWEKSWLAQSLSRQIIHHYSEWGLAKSEWDALDEYMQETADKVKTSSISFKDVWQEEKKRIEKLQFWEEVKGQWGFPEDIKVWHVHPLGLVENFYAQKSGDLICKDCGATITLTEEFLRHADVAPHASQAFIDELIKCSTELFPKYGVDTCRQIKHLLAQAKHETADPIGWHPPFTAFRERLVYSSAERAYQLSPTAINNGFARKGITFSTRQDKITWIQNNIVNNDRAYGEHLYGRNELPGKDFRGRGLLHLTHYDTYERCARAIGQPIDTQPELVESDPRIIIETGLWFWKNRNIAAIANNQANDGDAGVRNVTAPINVGLDGLANRQRYKREISVVFDQMFLGNHMGCRG